MWWILGHENSLAHESWPAWDENALKESSCEIPVSINGKLRAKIVLPADADESALENAALGDAKIVELLAAESQAGKTIVKKIIVPGKMVNFVVK